MWSLATSNKDIEEAELIEQILELQKINPKMKQSEIATEIGKSVGTVNKLIQIIKKRPKKTNVFN